MMDEESCSQSRVISSVTNTGHVTCTKKLGSGSLLTENMVDMIAVSDDTDHIPATAVMLFYFERITLDLAL